MISTKTSNEFLIRYYRWSLADGNRELAQGFPFLSTIKDPSALAKLEYLQSLSQLSRKKLMQALVKNAHRAAVELVDEAVTPEEQEFVSGGFDAMRSLLLKYIEKLFEERYLLPNRVKRASKRRLAKVVIEKLKPICGEVVDRESGLLWTHHQTIEGWSIYTQVDMGGERDLSYWHSITRRPDSTESLKTTISFTEWLGFGSTEWSMLSESDELTAANSIATLCDHFMTHAGVLLKDLPETS